jgi:hypothetical protein
MAYWGLCMPGGLLPSVSPLTDDRRARRLPTIAQNRHERAGRPRIPNAFMEAFVRNVHRSQLSSAVPCGAISSGTYTNLPRHQQRATHTALVWADAACAVADAPAVRVSGRHVYASGC